VFENALDKHDHEQLIPYKGRFNRGFEVPMGFKHEDKSYRLRMIILFDHGLCARKRKTLQNRVDRTTVAYQELTGKLNRYSLEPVYLHTPERIEAFLLLFKIALQIVVLIERTARKNIRQRDRGLDGFMPNRKDVRNPRSEYLLIEFEDIVKGQMPLPDGNTYGFVSELNLLQHDILSILSVPSYYYYYQYLFDTS